jgi:hypothetical protein
MVNSCGNFDKTSQRADWYFELGLEPRVLQGVYYEMRTVSQLEMLFREIRTTFRGTRGMQRD